MIKLWNSSSRVFRAPMYSTKTLAPNRKTAATTPTLYSRLSPIQNPKVSILPVLDQWVEEGRTVNQQDLYKIIMQFRKFDRKRHALEICQWMSDKPYLDVSPKYFSVQLDLIGKVHGLKQAEEYFEKIPDTMRVWQVYGALLSCYATAKSLEKAEATMQKMRELGYSKTLSYNVMLGLYSELKEYEKLDLLMEEMEQKGISFDKFTYAIRLNAYATTSDIQQMEKLLMKMEADPEVNMEFNAYTVTANGYLKAGDREKALVSLKKAEYLIRNSERKSAYEVLLTLYGSLGKKDEVYRVWNLYKNIGRFFNHGYVCMLSSLVKLDAIDDVGKIYDEWEAGIASFDYRIPNILIRAYCKKGLLEKAESLMNRLMASGKEPNASIWSLMTLEYVKNDMMDKAVESMRKTISLGSKVNTATLSTCSEYLKGKGDLDGAEEIDRLLQKRGNSSEVVCKSHMSGG